MAQKTIGSIRSQVKARLIAAGVDEDEARCESELIVEHVTGMTLARQIANDNVPVLGFPVAEIDRITRDRERRKPLQYCLGEADFMGQKFKVRPGVLIPRPDTETLAERALELLAGRSGAKIMDVGCGSGYISISLLRSRSDLTVYAIDVSEVALDCTMENAGLLKVKERIKLAKASWASLDLPVDFPADFSTGFSTSFPVSLPAKLDGIVSNPPYIPLRDKDTLMPEVRLFEPAEALFGLDEDGLGFFRQLSHRAPGILKEGGFIAVEFGFGQEGIVEEIFRADGWTNIAITEDLSRIPRVLSAFRPN